MAPPRPHRPGDAQLGPAFGSEHEEDEEDEEDAGDDRERPEGREQRHEGVALEVGVLQSVPLHGVDVEPELVGNGLQRFHDRIGVTRT